ncbi:Germ cell-less protein-like 1 [Mortierella sp. GBA30]|nr:Germ cell-less protein-like 1 [Mortierella sp. GBA30]
MSTAAGSLAQDMLLAFRDQQLSDITVMAFGQTFHLHRLILLRSGYFRSLVLGQGDWLEKSRQAITIKFDDPYVTLQSFQRIIHWLYGIDFHFPEGAAPITFRTTATAGGASETTMVAGFEGGRHGLGLRFDEKVSELSTIIGKSSVSNTETIDNSMAPRRYDNIMMDPSDKIDELLISMFAAASYLNITALMEEICSDIALRIRDNRGLIQYMEYAWKLNNGKAWDIILAQCFYQFFWSTYKSRALQDMLVSQDMPLVGLVKTLVSETLWVPNEYERYQLVKSIMLRRLNLDTEKLMSWTFEYHDRDWFMILKELDDNGTWSYELTPDTFLNNLLDWESTSTAEYEDAVDTDNEWASTTKELRRRTSIASTNVLFEEEDRTATPTAEKTAASAKVVKELSTSTDASRGSQELEDVEDNVEGGMEGHSDVLEKKTSPQPQSPLLETTPISSPSLSAVSITSDTLPRHQVRDLLILMYILHHSIHYTHMSFENLHQILTDGLVLSSRVKDAFWRQHLLRRIAVSTSPALPYLTAPAVPLYGRYHGAERNLRERRTPQTPGITRAKMSGFSSSRVSPAPVHSLPAPINSHGLLPIRFSTSLFISRRDLMTDGKHFTSSTFYGGSWWSIQVGNYLNADGQVGVFLSSAPVPRVVPKSGGASSSEGSSTRSRRQPPTAGGGGGGGLFFGALLGDQATTASRSIHEYRDGNTNTPGQQQQQQQQQGSDGNSGANGDCSSVYSRQRELTCSYRVYMTTNVTEPLQYFAATANSRLEKIRKRDLSHQHPSSIHSIAGNNSSGAFRPRVVAGSSTPTLPGSPDLSSGLFTKPPLQQNRIASEDELVCDGEGDLFKLNDGWGYKRSDYLTRVAKLVRDQPPKRYTQNQYPDHPLRYSTHGSNVPFSQNHHEQQQQQQQHHQAPVPASFVPLFHGQPHAIGQQQQQHQQHQQQQQHHTYQPLHQAQLHDPQQQQAQPANVAQAQVNIPSQQSQTGSYTSMRSEDPDEDDGLWIYFVVKVGCHDIKPPNQSRTASQEQKQQQQSQSQKQQQQQDQSRPAMVHSTHSNFETFDQATRDQRLEQESKTKGLASTPKDETLVTKQASAVDSEMGFQESNSGLQLDRDVQRSRRIADESRQKASGTARQPSWTNNQNRLPYVE